jgi:hypothetical protein
LPKRNFPRVGGVVEGQQHSGRPSHVSPLFLLIKTREEKKKRDMRGREEGREEKEREREREEKRERRSKKRKKKKQIK